MYFAAASTHAVHAPPFRVHSPMTAMPWKPSACCATNSISVQSPKVRRPVTVRVTTERNTVERFFMEFAPYEKQSERDLTTGECIVKIWYDNQDESELLIRLLAFGPTIEILSPSDFRQKAAERVFRQFELFN